VNYRAVAWKHVLLHGVGRADSRNCTVYHGIDGYVRGIL